MAFADTKSEVVGAVAVSQYDLVMTPGAAVVTTGPTVEPTGIVQDGAAIGAQVAMLRTGNTFARAAGVIAACALLMPAAAGEVTLHDGGGTSVQIGRNGEVAATAQGDLIEITLFTPTVLAQA